MAKILQCPGCQEAMDVTGLEVGSTVQCPGCDRNLMVPSGITSMRTKTVSASIPAQPARPPSGASRVGSSPRLQRPRDRSRSGTMPVPPQKPASHGGLFVGLGIGVLGIVIVVILFTMKGKEEETAKVHAPPPPKAPSTLNFNPTLPAGSEKPITMGEGNKAEVKPTTTLSRPSETAGNVNWPQLMQQLRPGGGFEHLDRPEGVAFQKVKSFGPAAYPKLIAFIDDEDTALGTAAVAVLNALTGRDEPLPKGVNKARIKAEWEEWLKKPVAPKPDEPKK
jgi:hypothetical protein